jgi:16S rRNA (uracil1498-N3)-methyltransferase
LTLNQFYVSRIDDSASRIILDGAEHHHLAKSARVRKGETVWLFDEKGHRVLARVESVDKDRTALEVLERAAPEEAGMKLVLAQALVPAGKMDFILEKASEFGISDFIPVETARSLKTPEERYGRKAERWARIARETTKQSKGTAVPVVHPPLRLKQFLNARGQGLRIFLSEHGGRPLRDLLLDHERSGRPSPPAVMVFIGPVGGWTEGEERDFRESGCEAVSLGRRILKSETAAVAAVAMISHFWNG